jgi:hypothetical protein
MMKRRLVLIFLEIFVIVFVVALAISCDDNPSSTRPNGEEEQCQPRWDPAATHPCNINKMSVTDYRARFGKSGLPPMYHQPVVITMDDNAQRNERFRYLSKREHLLDSFPSNFFVTLSSSNSFSEHRRTIPFSQYLQEMEDQSETLPDQRSNETWYLFGETFSDEWKDFLTNYELPICRACVEDSVALSFGIGNRGSGVQWHVHGPGFSEAVVGRKREYTNILTGRMLYIRLKSLFFNKNIDWILYKDKPEFHKDQTSRNWMEYTYSSMSSIDKPYECTLDPGDIIYFPNMVRRQIPPKLLV